MRLWLDTEVYSEVDLTKVGVYRYAEDRSTVLLLVAWAIDARPAQVWSCEQGPPPAELMQAMDDPTVEIWAHNAAFDRVVIGRHWHATAAQQVERWLCTMVQAREHGLPASLGKLGEALGLADDEVKLTEGRTLLDRFCWPGEMGRNYPWHYPDDWQRFCDYAARDVEAARECHRRMPTWNYPEGPERALWHLDQRINDRGMPVDRVMAAIAERLTNEALAHHNQEMARLTDGVVTKCTQVKALRDWLDAQGVPTERLNKAALEELLNYDLDPVVREALLLRQQANKTSTGKYGAILRMLSGDDRLRGTLLFCGAARTGRWSGRGVQIQNLPRGTVDADVALQAVQQWMVHVLYDSPLDALSTVVRAAFKAPAGRKLVCSDLSAIEGRVLAWLAGEQWKLDAYAAGEDLYVLAYAKAFGVAPAQVTKAQRQIGKVLELALGYQGSVGALQTMAALYGIELPEVEEQKRWVQAWRVANSAIVAFWYALEDAAKRALQTPGKVFTAGRLKVAVRRHAGRFWLVLRLPSGRGLCYYQPALEWVNYTMPDEETGEPVTLRRQQITFSDFKLGGYVKGDTYAGKLAENGTQGVSRDVLGWALAAIEREFALIGTVHDEVITEVDIDGPGAQRLSTLLATPPPWADGLPLAAAGFEAERYRKA